MYATVVTLGLLKAFGRNMALISLLLMVVTHFWLILSTRCRATCCTRPPDWERSSMPEWPSTCIASESCGAGSSPR